MNETEKMVEMTVVVIVMIKRRKEMNENGIKGSLFARLTWMKDNMKVNLPLLSLLPIVHFSRALPRNVHQNVAGLYPQQASNDHEFGEKKFGRTRRPANWASSPSWPT